jgi:hypothetical protein
MRISCSIRRRVIVSSDRSPRRRPRWLVRLAVVLLVALAALFWTIVMQRASLEIENRSEQSIAELHVTIAGQTSDYQNVPAGASVSVPSPVRGEAAVRVTGKLANDTRIFFQGRMSDSLHFILLPGGQLEPRRKGTR